MYLITNLTCALVIISKLNFYGDSYILKMSYILKIFLKSERITLFLAIDNKEIITL